MHSKIKYIRAKNNILLLVHKSYSVIFTFENIGIANFAVPFVKNYPGRNCQTLTCCVCWLVVVGKSFFLAGKLEGNTKLVCLNILTCPKPLCFFTLSLPVSFYPSFTFTFSLTENYRDKHYIMCALYINDCHMKIPPHTCKTNKQNHCLHTLENNKEATNILRVLSHTMNCLWVEQLLHLNFFSLKIYWF